MIIKVFNPAMSSTSDFCGQLYNILSGEDYSPDIALFIDSNQLPGIIIKISTKYILSFLAP
jgi:hypothetical protein